MSSGGTEFWQIVVSAGAAAGFTGFAGLLLQRREHISRSNATRAALAVELVEITRELYDPELVVREIHGSRITARDVLETHQSTKDLRDTLHYGQKKPIEAPMYEALRPELGRLPPELVSRTARFYLALARHNALIERILSPPAGVTPYLDPEDYYSSRHRLFVRAAVLAYRMDPMIRSKRMVQRRKIGDHRRAIRAGWSR